MSDVPGRILSQPQGVVGSVLLAVLAAIVVFGPALAPYDPESFHPSSRLIGPSEAFWLGTDHFGRDILSRLLWGARTTVLLSLLATAIGALAGGALGILSGYAGCSTSRPRRWMRRPRPTSSTCSAASSAGPGSRRCSSPTTSAW